MELLGGLIIVLGFIGLATAFNLLDQNRKVIEIARSSASVIADKSLDDLQKEQTLQRNATKLLKLFFLILGSSLAALGIPLGLVWGMDALNFLSFEGVIKTITSAWFILATVGISILYLLLTRERKNADIRHTQLEQTLHSLAFETWFPRVPLSKLESLLYKNQLAPVSVERPAFITALPRAGTTLILELCAGMDEFATHKYRDMPFLLSPLLWNRFSGNLRDPEIVNERVHGDGIMVSVDSPEAFEEILWKEFWPSYYKKNRILPWSESPYPDFEAFFLEHMRKLILLRGREGFQARYISKNNQNIARVGYLASIFPDATILVLFRAPLQHAASLLKQHRNFLAIHQEDPFAQGYMEDTGHFDFGHNLRPVDFKGWLAKEGETDPDRFDFWLRYWIHTYRYLLKDRPDRVHFFSFDALCAEPQRGLKRLGEILDVKDPEQLLSQVDRIRQPRLHPVDREAVSPSLLEEAEALYRELQTAAKA